MFIWWSGHWIREGVTKKPISYGPVRNVLPPPPSARKAKTGFAKKKKYLHFR